MTAEQLIAFLNAPGSDDVHIAVQRYGPDVYRAFEAGRCELAFAEKHVALKIGDECIDFYNAAAPAARSTLRELRRLLNDPRVVAEIERPEVRTLRSAA